MIKINGTVCDSADGMTLTDYLKNAEFDLQRVAVEKNGMIIPKNKYSSVIVEAGDEIEIVNFVGGG